MLNKHDIKFVYMMTFELPSDKKNSIILQRENTYFTYEYSIMLSTTAVYKEERIQV